MKVLSVLIPVYNKGKYIKKTFRSINSQVIRGKFKYEVIIVDDASSDDSLEKMNNFVWTNPDIVRVEVLKNEVNSGPAVSFNKALANSTGDYIVPHDADDLITGLGLLKRFEALEQDLKFDWVCGNVIKMKIDSKVIAGIEFLNESFVKDNDHEALFERILEGKDYLAAQSWIIRRKVFDSIEWPSKMRSSQDTALALLLLVNKVKLKKIDDYVAIYRSHTKSNRGEGLFVSSVKSGQKVKDFQILRDILKPKLTNHQLDLIDKKIESLNNHYLLNELKENH